MGYYVPIETKHTNKASQIMTNAQAIKEIRLTAKNAGLTFKVQPGITLNGGSIYMFTDRKTGERVIENSTLGGAYNDVCSGFISSYNKETSNFEGV